ncbi:sigma-70 family RNA polymerase sigma factor [Neobacillus rhizosphaerae]|uniref:sigma-70 family RNA polymerase sigma factor n=1 Tax=Neobacillus rhizosphaerae TaxID=2880965 RepID=UPI003D2C0BFA
MTLSGNDGILNGKLFITLFETNKDSIYRMAYMYMKNQSDSLDIVQEVAYRAFKNRNSLKELNYFKTWILKITINASIDFLRKKQKVVELPFTRELGTQQTEDRYSDLLLNELLYSLDEDEKRLIYLKYYQDYTFHEISEIVEAPVSTVKSKIYRTLEKIRLDYPKEELS